MPSRRHIQFMLNGEDIRLDDVTAADTLLDFLRIRKRLTGTKEGCAEGDCGACTVLVGHLNQGQLRYEAVNACIRFLASLDGCHVVSVEYLAGTGGKMHPVQQAMVDFHASQCGFCTPGFVMALYALWMENPSADARQVETALQGNLCRCTGYQPIIKAALAMTNYDSPARDILNTERDAVTARLRALQDGARVEIGPHENRAILPASLDDLAQVLLAHPDATIISGATDVGLWVTKMMRPISPAVFVGHLDELKQVKREGNTLSIGAATSYSASEEPLAAHFPHLRAYWHRIAGWQVRNMGTIGGNVANGSPIGDTPPALIALDAQVHLRRGAKKRSLPIEDFFIDYGKQDRAPGEFIEKITLPLPQAGSLHAAYKISKRRDEDISSVAAAFHVRLDGGTISAARIAFGGMAATPKRAYAAETALIGQPFTEDSFTRAAQTLSADFTPLSDWRASAEYRLQVAQNLFRRFYLEQDQSAAPARLEHV